MSKTHCRFCKETFEGIYVYCPKCKRNLIPKEYQAAPKQVEQRLEYLRGEIRAERISYGEIAELQSLAENIEPGDVELLQWAGVPEFSEDDFESVLDWAFTQIISPDNMLPTLDEQKAWLLKEHIAIVQAAEVRVRTQELKQLLRGLASIEYADIDKAIVYVRKRLEALDSGIRKN